MVVTSSSHRIYVLAFTWNCSIGPWHKRVRRHIGIYIYVSISLQCQWCCARRESTQKVYQQHIWNNALESMCCTKNKLLQYACKCAYGIAAFASPLNHLHYEVTAAFATEKSQRFSSTVLTSFGHISRNKLKILEPRLPVQTASIYCCCSEETSNPWPHHTHTHTLKTKCNVAIIVVDSTLCPYTMAFDGWLWTAFWAMPCDMRLIWG